MAYQQKSSKWTRADDCRSEFIKNNPGIMGAFYLCAYCCKPVHRDDMEVDHLVAVNRVHRNPYYKIYLTIVNWFTNIGLFLQMVVTGKEVQFNRGVNVNFNLIPACHSCNKSKSDWGGMWVIRGFFGGLLWKFINTIQTMFRSFLSSKIGRLSILGFILYLAIAVLLFDNTLLDAIKAFIATIVTGVSRILNR